MRGAAAAAAAAAAAVVAAAGGAAAQYTVTATRLSTAPLVDATNSAFTYAYNAALFVGTDGAYTMLVRVQNASSPAQPYNVTPSVMAVSKFVDASWTAVTPITAADVTFSNTAPAEACGAEDPRVAYNPVTAQYELFYTAYNCSTAQLSLATSPDPTQPAAWVRHGQILAAQGVTWSKSGAALLRATGSDSLIWGDEALTFATSADGVAWSDVGTFMTTRADGFDSTLVEAGPPPLPLSDGNLLFLYNSARAGYPSVKPGWDLQYNMGFAILNGSNPAQILQRSGLQAPLFSPVLPWEVGNATAAGQVSLTPNVVFCEGALPLPGSPDTFLFVYGAADSRVGVGTVTVVTPSQVEQRY